MKSGTGANAVVPFFAHLTLHLFKFSYVEPEGPGGHAPPDFIQLVMGW